MANSTTTLMRFLEAQNKMYLTAFSEIEKEKKETHWMWFIFPQIKGLGHSDTANYYAISDLKEAEEFLQHPILGKHFIEITTLLLRLKHKSAEAIFGDLDALKLRSSMTLFASAKNTNLVFQEVLDAYFAGQFDPLTLSIINSKLNRPIEQKM
ncbi:DUF1810 domain-containing protein [Flavobacterium granuli]|uniref:Uncharacterized protein (DUF1810 family) n=1 Tax=Flavobacterium granuli TaxID=280093 RepID=A0ABU1S3M4_9FLAO|nr:DUF1810 domain-containing protein [Flavobacterium granuli]MDR6845634.1 uncharacterized protein (DUF1810 family) [Flavobacterium granuli]